MTIIADPLELRTDSSLGVPGLLEVVRQGNVLVANALGSGVLESPGLPGFLPGIAKKLFDEELLLPSVASWWCGEAPVMEEALSQLDELLLRPAFPSQSFVPVFGQDLDAKARAALVQRVRDRPYAYVAQARAQLSQAPVWQSAGQLVPRAIGMRVFAVASAEGYRILPGGLTRVAADADAEVVSMQRGGASKDTWVVGDRSPVGEPWQSLRALGVADLVRSDPYLPSRVVENLFWFGRYVERCEDSVRLLRVLLARYVGDDHDPLALQAAVALGEGLGLLPKADFGSLEERLREALAGSTWPFSLKASLQRLQWAAGSVRGKLSQSHWQALLELQRDAQVLEGAIDDFGVLLDYLDRLSMSLSALSGFVLDDMTRDDGWRFLMLGRCIERLQFLAQSIAGLLYSRAAHDQAALEWLLELGNSIITYRTRYLAAPQLIPVLDLLLLDEQNPHAVIFQLRQLLRSSERLAESFDVQLGTELEPLCAQLLAFRLQNLEQPVFGASGQRAVLSGLADLLLRMAAVSAQLSDQLALRFFVHVDSSRGTLSS